MSLHDLFSAAVNYPITLQDVGNVVEFAGIGVALFLVLSFAAVFAYPRGDGPPPIDGRRQRCPANFCYFGPAR